MIRTLLFMMSACGLCLGLATCKPEKTVNNGPAPQYSMQFNLVASGTPVTVNQTITNASTRYYVEVLRFYTGLPRLVKTDGTEVPLANAFIVKFDTGIPDNQACGHLFQFSIPEGSYKAIRFGVGVPPVIRDTVTHYHYGATDPLNPDFGLLWTMSSTGKKNVFRNIGMTLMADTSKAQNLAPTRFLSYHILEDDTTLNLYKQLEFNEAFTVKKGDSHTSVFNLDINNVFFNTANPIDIRHSGSTDMIKGDDQGIALGVKINSNFSQSISKP